MGGGQIWRFDYSIFFAVLTSPASDKAMEDV